MVESQRRLGVARFARYAGVALVISVISTTLLLQFATSFKLDCLPAKFGFLSFSRQFCSPALWPFLEYDMYEGTHYPGDQLSNRVLVATLADSKSSEVQLSVEDFGFENPWLYENFLDAVARRDEPSVTQYVTAYDHLHAVPLTAVRLELHVVEFTPQGFVEREPIVEQSLSVAP
jgi:hypothetical protein